MKIIGCDFHTRQQQIEMLDTETGEIARLRLEHGNGEARRFYEQLQGPVVVGIGIHPREAALAIEVLRSHRAQQRIGGSNRVVHLGESGAQGAVPHTRGISVLGIADEDWRGDAAKAVAGTVGAAVGEGNFLM